MLIYTIGYGGRQPRDFLHLLAQHGVRAVVDVRLRPDRASMGCYSLAKTPDKGIQKLLSEASIAYQPFVQLGNVFVDRQDRHDRYEQLLVLAGRLLTEPLLSDMIPSPYCLMCAEKSPTECHRSLISNYLGTLGHEIRHIE